MKRILLKSVLAACLLPLAALAGDPVFNGRWRLDPARSTALDGWSTLDLVITVEGSILEAVRPVTFRTGSMALNAGRVCALPRALRSARIAGA